MTARRAATVFGLTPVATLSVVTFAGAIGMAPAAASSAAVSGWWSQANTGALAPPAPPQVPADGMYAANGAAGPLAVSAVQFLVPNGQQAVRFVLEVAGSGNVMSSPPVACAITATTPFKAEQDGPWADRPTYDCSRAQVVGSPDSTNTRVVFDATRLTSSGSVSAVVMAGGAADQIAFEKPTAASLVTAAATAPGPAAGSASGPAPAQGAPTLGTDQQASAASAGAPVLAGADPIDPVGNPAPDLVAAGVPLPTEAAPGAPSPPAPAGRSNRAPAPAPSGYQGGGPVGAQGTTSTASRVATGLGMAAMLLALVGYAQGRGVLGGRIVPLAARPARRRGQGAGGANVSA